MNWICIGLLAGSLVTSLHNDREACEGRAVVLREAKASAKCVEMPTNTIGWTTNCSNCTLPLGR